MDFLYHFMNKEHPFLLEKFLLLRGPPEPHLQPPAPGSPVPGLGASAEVEQASPWCRCRVTASPEAAGVGGHGTEQRGRVLQDGAP